MPGASLIDLAQLAKDVGLPVRKTERALALLDAGNTIAFITRYRKDQTGGLDEEQIRQIQAAALKRRQLAERKDAILKSIESQGKLTATLAEQIRQAESTKQLEDLYLPFKPRKQTLATLARQRGLEPLANEIQSAAPQAADRTARAAEWVDGSEGRASIDEVLSGVQHLLAERYSERSDVRARLRGILQQTGQLISVRHDPPARPAAEEAEDASATEKTKAKKLEKKNKQKQDRAEAAFRDYYDYREALKRIPPHRILAINRGERAKVLRVRVEGALAPMMEAAAELVIPADHPHRDFLRICLQDGMDRLILPSLERELRRELTERAEEHAVSVFARNLRNLLLQPPVRGRRLLAIDPGFRSGCKLAVLDAFGNPLHHDLLFIVGTEDVRQAGRRKLVELVQQYELSLIAIGNGTASRETEQLVASVLAEELKESNTAYVIVNEAGASVYSTSPLGREELPEYDPVVRSAVSIGRRLLDPLSELVKITPAHLGVGMYQHDIKAKHLRDSLDAVVESCVNFVGVDLNTSSPALLSYVSGLNQLTARRVYEHRCQHGPFRRREQLMDVPGIGETTFVQAAGFLKITDGDNPLDATWIHPESYEVAHRLLQRLGGDVDALSRCVAGESVGGQLRSWQSRIAELDLPSTAAELEVGELLLADLLAALTRPGRDPRDDLSPPMFRTGIVKLDDLEPGMELSGTVLNVVDFGAFVDIGISDSALIHISRLANRFVRDPHEVVSVGDVLRVWVVEVDRQRRRVSLTAVSPDAPRPAKAPAAAPAPRPAAPPKPAAPRAVSPEHKGPRPPKYRSAPPQRPLTDAMAEGEEPMRSFSDLLQFYERKKPPGAGGDRSR